MAKLRPTYVDNKGHPHPTADSATITDMFNLLALPAKTCADILAKREPLEALFREHDAMQQPTAKVASLDDARRRAK